jgi:hypothetical protein
MPVGSFVVLNGEGHVGQVRYAVAGREEKGVVSRLKKLAFAPVPVDGSQVAVPGILIGKVVPSEFEPVTV